jgi:hypothetical protein
MKSLNLARLFRQRRWTQVAPGLPNTLSGYFELRVDRLVGSVTDGFGTKVASIRIDVLCRGEVIASFAAEPEPKHGRFHFSFPVDGRFTGAELVKEQVVLKAYDSNGNSGRLRLDGAAQLELLRDHLGVPSVTVLDLDFSAEGNARPYLGAGWSGSERDFTWTEDDDSFVTFDSPTEPGTYALRITAGTILHKPELTSQLLKIVINGEQVDQTFYNESFVQFRECRFDRAAFRGEGRVTLRLHHPDAVRPCDIGPSRDSRRLAFNVKRLSIARLLPET